MALTRRQFFKVATTAAGAVAFTGCYPVGQNAFKVASPLLIPEDQLNGVDTWYATTSRMGRGDEGLIVRVINGRARKVEGNPDFPVNMGKSSATCQAAVQELYHPDRIRGPLKRSGDRGTGLYQPITWDEALRELSAQLGRAQGGSLVFVTEPLRGHQALVVQNFVKGLGGQHLAFETFDPTVERAAMQRLFGQDRLPDFDIGQARFLLSFGADFLGTWLSPTQYSREYGQFRQGRPDARGYFVQVEPRLSHTAASADEWIPIRPGMEGVLALSIAQQLIAQNLVGGNAAALGGISLDAFQPARVAATTGVSADRITALAKAFGSQKPSLAIGGGQTGAHTNGLFNLLAIYTLNSLVGSVGQAGGIRFNPAPVGQNYGTMVEAAPFKTWQQLAERMKSGQGGAVNALLVHRANPLYGLPAQIGLRDGLAKVPFIASFSSFLDETTAMADLIVPDHHFLESWGDNVPDPGPGFPAMGLQQPVVKPFNDTRSMYDVLLGLAGQMGGQVKQGLPWANFRDALREGIRQLQGQGGAFQSQDLEAFWLGLLQRGGWWNQNAPAAAAPAARPANLPAQAPQPTFDGDANSFPFHLVVYPHNTLHGGEGAHLPWLQQTPDPMTSVAWQTWVEINPKKAHELGLEMGDVVAVESQVGRLELPVYVYPGIGPEAVAIPAGQGHRFYGRYAEKRGANPFEVIAPLTDSETGALAWSATRVRLVKTGRHVDLPRMEGGVTAYQLPGQNVVQVTKG